MLRNNTERHTRPAAAAAAQDNVNSAKCQASAARLITNWAESHLGQDARPKSVAENFGLDGCTFCNILIF